MVMLPLTAPVFLLKRNVPLPIWLWPTFADAIVRAPASIVIVPLDVPVVGPPVQLPICACAPPPDAATVSAAPWVLTAILPLSDPPLVVMLPIAAIALPVLDETVTGPELTVTSPVTVPFA